MVRRTMTRLVYLGPDGTFTHQAALALAPPDARLRPVDSLEQVLDAVISGAAEQAVAAETSAAGPIAATAQALAAGQVEAVARHTLDISFDLYRRPGDDSPLEGVYGHEKALGQISHWIEEQGLKSRAAASNTAGLVALRDGHEPGWGAAGPPGLSQAYALEVRAQGLEGRTRNQTVFVLLRRASSTRPD